MGETARWKMEGWVMKGWEEDGGIGGKGKDER